jgi:hypothetical protein
MCTTCFPMTKPSASSAPLPRKQAAIARDLGGKRLAAMTKSEDSTRGTSALSRALRRRGLALRDQLAPSTRLIDQTLLQRAQADIAMLLAHAHTSVGPLIATRYPTVQMHIHDGQLFGLHGWDETGRSIDQKLTRELHAHRPIGFGAPTAKTTAARGCGQVDSSSWRSKRPAGREQRFALPTARDSAHLPTAFHRDVQETLLRELTDLILEDTRPHSGGAPVCEASHIVSRCLLPIDAAVCELPVDRDDRTRWQPPKLGVALPIGRQDERLQSRALALDWYQPPCMKDFICQLMNVDL